MERIKEIIEGCVAGKRHCQELLYKMFSDVLFAVSLRYSGDYEEARDNLQDGFIKILNNIKQYSGKGSFEGWMKRIVINTALEKYRKKNQMLTVSVKEELCQDQVYEDVEEKISADDLMKMIMELPPRYKLVFNLYAIEGYSHAEISNMLDISEGTSKSNLSRARTILQNKLKKNLNPVQMISGNDR